MKKLLWIILVLFPLIAHSQTIPKDQSLRWAEVERLMQIKNYEQTLPILADIKATAIKENDEGTWLRAFLAETNVTQINSSDDQAFIRIDQNFQKGIRESKSLIKDVLYNFYATFLHSNFNRYLSKSENKFLAANAEQKSNIIDSLYKLSLSNTQLLQKENISNWKEMFVDMSNVSLTPTLYHYLSYSYLNFLKNDNILGSQLIEDKTNEIIAFNDKNGYDDASSYILSEGIKHQNTYSRDYELNYEKVIEQYHCNYSVYLIHQLAEYYNRNNQQDKALSLLQKAKEDFPQSPWLDLVNELENQIKKVEIKLSHDLFVPSMEYSPLKLALRNVDSLFIRIYNTTNRPNDIKFYQTKYDSITYEVRLDVNLMYEEVVVVNMHKGKVLNSLYKINPMDYGRYTLMISNNKEFKDDGLFRDVAVSNLQITDLFISATLDAEKENSDIYNGLIIHRKSGQPFSNKRLKFYEISEKKPLKLSRTLKTNNKGQFSFQTDNRKNISDLEDHELFIEEENQLIDLYDLDEIPEHLREDIIDYYVQDEDENFKIESFLDRGIYRPGQPLYFKAILFNNKYKAEKALSKEKIEVFLLDANNTKVDSIKLISNEFGSINGEFKLPSQTLAGMFTLSFTHRNTTRNINRFRVEEYKRPTFLVKFKKNEETYTHQDTAKFEGHVESFSGAVLSDAAVNYKIQISAYGRRSYNQIHVDSTIHTDVNGNFVLKLPLMDSILKSFEDFNISYQVEVVSNAGEMQTASDQYFFSSTPWNIDIESPNYVEEFKWKSLNIKTTNQNQQPLQFAGEVEIFKLEETQIILPISQESVFNNIDFHIISKTDYKKYFPNLFDDQLIDGKKRKSISKFHFDTRDTNYYTIDSTLFPQGEYEIEATSIIGSDTIKNNRTTKVYNPISKKSTSNSFLSYTLDKDRYKLGDKVNISFLTDIDDPQKLFIIQESYPAKKSVEILDWKNGKVDYNFIFTRNHSNNKIKYHVLFVKDNKMEKIEIYIPLETEDKKLDIKVQTFRDKITPGQVEKWSFTVKKNNEDKEAEVLASMYDSSLDQFYSINYNLNIPQNIPYYQSLNFYYLTNNFYSNNSSYSLFSRKLEEKKINNHLPYVRNYGLWKYFSVPPRIMLRGTSFAKSDAVLNEVVVMSTALEGKVSGLKIDLENNISIRGSSSSSATKSPLYVVNGEIVSKEEFERIEKENIQSIDVLKAENAMEIYGSRAENGVMLITTKDARLAKKELDNIQARTNLQETAFFFPDLRTDKDGNVTFEFDSPEALTKWKLLLFTHSKEMDYGSGTFFTQTQKQLMVRPNLPRYFREGDEITIKVLLQNLSKKALKGDAKIELINPETNEIINNLFLVDSDVKGFDTEENKDGLVEWKLKIPENIQMVQIKVVAGTDEFSDGEIVELPILMDKILINDTEKIVLQPSQKTSYEIDSEGKDNVQLKIQVQSNPILEIISALDYLKSYPYECSEQMTSKWFALGVIRYIEKNYPEISTYFKQLNNDGIQSKLEANAELSTFKVEEMPWIKVIENDERKLNELAKLFNSNISAEILRLEKNILKNQSKDGGFPWFDGGKADTHISIRILEIYGKLLSLDKSLVSKNILTSANKLINYLDVDTNIFDRKAHSETVLDYLYARKYWTEYYSLSEELSAKLKRKMEKSPIITAEHSAGTAAKAWIVNQLFGRGKESDEIRNRLQQELIEDEQIGIYWRSNIKNYNSVSLQSYMVEAYKINDPSKLKAMTQWLFFKKESQYWGSTWMTVDALYALLIANDPKDFSLENNVLITLNTDSLATDSKILGQVSKVIPADQLSKSPILSVQNNNTRTIYGGIYHQYFLASKAIKSASNSLSVEKVYLVSRNGEWKESKEAKLGEKIKVRITIINDSPIQYVHLKDSRPAGVEPIFRSSGYQWWQGYYFTLKDASTNYFFDSLSKGKHTYEYEVKANNLGIFNSGLSTIECMYDPSVNARSENTVINIVK